MIADPTTNTTELKMTVAKSGSLKRRW